MGTGSPVRVHHTETSEKSWDSGPAERRLPDDAPLRTYRRAFAWVDTSNPDAKTAHKFPHHDVSAEGKVGPANVRACSSGIGILNGARGGADIPASHRRGIYRHLAAHMRDAGEDPPELDG